MADTDELDEPTDPREPTMPRELNDTREPTDTRSSTPPREFFFPRGSTQPREFIDPRSSTQPIELNDNNELNDPDEPDDPDDPMKLQPQLQGTCVYAVLHNTQPGDENDRIDIEGIYMDFRDAVGSLRLLRLGLVDSWIAPMDPDDRENFPHRNRIGEIWRDGWFLGWGYAWFNPRNGGSVDRVWIQKCSVWRREGGDHLSDDSDEERQVLGATKDIEFVAGQDLPEDSTFDERTQDLRFSGEEGDREEDELEESVHDQNLPGEIMI
jgi:hypothetical protein